MCYKVTTEALPFPILFSLSPMLFEVFSAILSKGEVNKRRQRHVTTSTTIRRLRRHVIMQRRVTFKTQASLLGGGQQAGCPRGIRRSSSGCSGCSKQWVREARVKKIKTWQDLNHSLHDNWECSEVFLKASQHTAPVCCPQTFLSLSVQHIYKRSRWR